MQWRINSSSINEKECLVWNRFTRWNTTCFKTSRYSHRSSYSENVYNETLFWYLLSLKDFWEQGRIYSLPHPKELASIRTFSFIKSKPSWWNWNDYDKKIIWKRNWGAPWKSLKETFWNEPLQTKGLKGSNI